jgi:predicted DNA binding CopG/RHH family protein
MSEPRRKKQIQIPKKPRADEWVAQGREKATAPEQKMKRLTLDLPEGLHRAIKRRAVEEGVTMVDMLRTLLEQQYGARKGVR